MTGIPADYVVSVSLPVFLLFAKFVDEARPIVVETVGDYRGFLTKSTTSSTTAWKSIVWL